MECTCTTEALCHTLCERNRTGKKRTEQNRTEQNRTEQNRTEQNRKEKKRKEKTTPFGVNLMNSQVLYRAAQPTGDNDRGRVHSHTSGCRSWLLPQQVPFIISNLNSLSANV